MIDEDVDEADGPGALAFLRRLARVDDGPPPDDELRTGDRIARFTIVKRLGTGGMGAVYEVRDETLGRSVALKVMRRASDAARERFIREARAAAAVSHPNLIVVHEIGEAEGRAYIVMELIRGRTLRALVIDRPAQAEAIRILAQVARGVAAAHAAGVVHRDLKPENVMLRDDGSVVVLDFGIARLDTDHPTGTDVAAGTPQYMSPEQALGHRVDARSDVYSFGVLAYELLTGTRPGPDPRANVSPLVDKLLARCLAVDPQQRYADAREVREVLDGVQHAKRRRWIAPVMALAVVAGAVGVWQARSRESPSEPRPLGASPTLQSANQEAINAYRGGWQQLRDGMFFEAVQSWERATALDPSFAAAHLRLAIFKRFVHSPDEARQSYEIAVKNREQLDARDRTILHAVEPIIARDPYDNAEARRRLTAATDDSPLDAELLYYLASTYGELGEHDRMLAVVGRVQAIDPTAPAAWSMRAWSLLYLGDRQGAREAAIECRRLAPMQSGCAFELTKILNDMGSCRELEAVVRDWQIASGDSPKPLRDLAWLLLSEHRPLDAVRDANARARQLTPVAGRAELDQIAGYEIARATGDFDAAEAQLRAWLEPWNPGVADDLIDILEETGRGTEARTLAERFFAIGEAGFVGKGTSDLDLYNDRTGVMLATLRRHGGMSRDDVERRHQQWVRDLESRIGGDYAAGIWAQAYALTVRTAQEAAAAVTVMPERQPPFFWFTHMYGAVGRTLVLANRPHDALPYLTRATHRCFDRDARDYYYLGLVQEAIGDRAAACASYAELITRWQAARPGSATLDLARTHASTLQCEVFP